MRKLQSWLLAGMCLVAVSVGAGACSGGGDDDDDDDGGTQITPAPPPYDFNMTGDAFEAFAGGYAAVRILDATGAVVFCGTSGAVITTGGDFTIMAADVFTVAGGDYDVEVVAHGESGQNPVFNVGTDRNHAFALGVVNTNVNLYFQRPSTETDITWTEGVGCPGE